MHQPLKLYFVLTLFFLTTSGLIYLFLQQKFTPAPTQIVVTPTSVTYKVPTDTPYQQPIITVTLAPTEIPTPIPTPPFTTFTNQDYNFTVTYPSYRKYFQEKSTSGSRFVFYRPDANNMVVHAGSSWSWTHPGRDLTSGSFLYEASNQTLKDLPSDQYKYTLQCVHNQNKELKLECESFFNSFKIN